MSFRFLLFQSSTARQAVHNHPVFQEVMNDLSFAAGHIESLVTNYLYIINNLLYYHRVSAEKRCNYSIYQ